MTRHRVLTLVFYFCLGALLFLFVARGRAGDPSTVTFINVGQGDAALLSDGSGFHALVDGGNTNQGAVILQYLRSHGITTLDCLVATHPDSDHIGGLVDVLKADDILVRQVIYSGYPGTTLTWDAFVNAAAADQLTLTTIQFPAELNWGRMHVLVLNPASGATNLSSNDSSLVLKVSLDQTDFLLSGDISASIEATVVARQTPVAAEVLKVAHHGSAYSSSTGFLQAVNPQEAIISVGKNSYGHPAVETLERLEAAQATIWRTDFAGDVTISTGVGMTYTLTTQFTPVFVPLLNLGAP